MAEGFGSLRSAIDEIAAGPVWSLSDDQLADDVIAVFAANQRLMARLLALLGEADGRGLAKRHGASSTAAWLTQTVGCSRPEAHRTVDLARMLAAAGTELEATGEALATGQIGVEQTRIIASTIRELPAEVGVDGKTRCAALLTELAKEKATPETLAAHRDTILERVAPEIAEEHLRKQLERAERAAYERRGLTLTAAGLGEVRLRAILPTEAAAIIKAAIDPLAAPRSREPNGDPEDVDGPGCDGRDPRSAAARRADALTEVCRRALAHGDLPENGGEKPHLVVTMDWQALRDGVAGGILDTGERLTPATTRRLACDALVIPAILGGAGQPLDLGRARRLIDGPLRRALVLRDRGCAFPNCDRPPAWCDGHHIQPWTDGGPTSLDNSVLLCGFHHTTVHTGGWQVRLAQDGHPEFIPPPHVDPQRRPQRNRLHRGC
jgi:hypothetical protein